MRIPYPLFIRIGIRMYPNAFTACRPASDGRRRSLMVVAVCTVQDATDLRDSQIPQMNVAIGILC